MANCVHGFAQGQCLICQALGTGPGPSGSTKTKVASPVQAPSLMLDEDLDRALPATRSRSQKPERSPGGRSRPSGMKALFAIVGVVVVAGLAVWLFAGIFDLAFHLFEYAAIAVIAGWIGYKVGHMRGRRHRD